MICIPGVTFVDFNATSVTRLISIPGEISTNSDACPAMGRKPCDTVAKNDATCGCKLSKKMYERRSAMLSSFRVQLVLRSFARNNFARGLLQNLHAARRADARRARGHHLHQIRQ